VVRLRYRITRIIFDVWLNILCGFTGNSKALIEEEKFRKNGKKKYETLSEKLMHHHQALLSLVSTPLIVHFEMNSIMQTISSQAASIIRAGHNHKSQERVELMHLHTMTHGTRRWSGGGGGNDGLELDVNDIEISESMTTASSTSTAAPLSTSSSQPVISPMLSVPAPSIPSKLVKGGVNGGSLHSPRAHITSTTNHSSHAASRTMSKPVATTAHTKTVAKGHLGSSASSHSLITDENIRKN
jgi:hypothetical protein